MTEYCTPEDVRNRLTANGYLNVSDLDGDGLVDTDEIAASITSAIEWAGAEIDYALINHQPPYSLPVARASGNIFLRSRAIDCAAWQVTTHGGRDVLARSRRPMNGRSRCSQGSANVATRCPV